MHLQESYNGGARRPLTPSYENGPPSSSGKHQQLKLQLPVPLSLSMPIPLDPRFRGVGQVMMAYNNHSNSQPQSNNNLPSIDTSFVNHHHNHHHHHPQPLSAHHSTSFGSSLSSGSLSSASSSSLHLLHHVEDRLQQQQAYRRSTDVALCKTILTTATMAPYFPKFVATFVYSIWHNQSFTQLTQNPSHGLVEFSFFVRDLLKVTKLSFSVVILSLKYIHRIKHRCRELQGKPGSEYRLLVCTLNLAMKYLVDHTYSNKTWHKLSRIPLLEINMAEIEFMTQLDFYLHVEQESFFAWLSVVDDSFAKFRRLLDINGGNTRHHTPPLTPSSPSVLPPTPTTIVALPSYPFTPGE